MELGDTATECQNREAREEDLWRWAPISSKGPILDGGGGGACAGLSVDRSREYFRRVGMCAIFSRIPGELSLEEARALYPEVADDVNEGRGVYLHGGLGRLAVMPLAVMIAPSSVKPAAWAAEQQSRWCAFRPYDKSLPPFPLLGLGLFLAAPSSLALAGVVGSPPAILLKPAAVAWFPRSLVREVAGALSELPREELEASLASYPPCWVPAAAVIESWEHVCRQYLEAASNGQDMLLHWQYR